MEQALERIDQLEVELGRAVIERSTANLRQKLVGGAYVYGAGSFGRRVVQQLVAQGFNCLGVIDRNAGAFAGEVEGVPLFHPDQLTVELCANHILVIGVFNPFHDLGEIVRAMRLVGFADIFWGADVPDALGACFNDFWLGGRAFLHESFSSIRYAYDLLEDQTSKKTLESVIRFRCLNGDVPEPTPQYETQYLPPDLPKFQSPIRLLDGGAYDGDTFRSLRRFGVEIDAWYAFEPDAENFVKLVSFAQGVEVISNLSPCGLAAKTEQLCFAAGQDTGSRIVDRADSSVTIQCLSIDEAFINVPFDYVKLDIEGAEVAALNGMRKMIARYQPRLAISAYHRPEDLWIVPLKLRALLPEASIYLRQHYPNTFEVVAYAIPPGR